MRVVLRKLAFAAASVMVGLAILFWGLERGSLIELAAQRAGTDFNPSFGLYFSIFAGLILLNLGVLSSLKTWSKYTRENPDVKGLPLGVLIGSIVVFTTALTIGSASHSAYVHSLETVPTDVSPGFIAFQAVLGSAALAPLVIAGTRWSPGARRRMLEQ